MHQSFEIGGKITGKVLVDIKEDPFPAKSLTLSLRGYTRSCLKPPSMPGKIDTGVTPLVRKTVTLLEENFVLCAFEPGTV